MRWHRGPSARHPPRRRASSRGASAPDARLAFGARRHPRQASRPFREVGDDAAATVDDDQNTKPQFTNVAVMTMNPTQNTAVTMTNRRPTQSSAIAQNAGKRTMRNRGAESSGRAGSGYDRISATLVIT